jgi:anti-anti-sigma regulatory factor
MSVYSPALPGGTAAAPTLTPVHLADLTAKQLAALLVAPPPHLLVDCGGLLLPHPLGVCRFVAQLLQMRQRGTCLWLCNIHPALYRCLLRLELDALFHLKRVSVAAPAVLKLARATSF